MKEIYQIYYFGKSKKIIENKFIYKKLKLKKF